MSLLKSKTLWTLLIVASFIAIAIAMVPKGFNTDLSSIGQGKPSVVFVYDMDFAVSVDQAAEMNKARSVIGDQALFLVAKVGTPNGEAFMQKYNASGADILFFSGDGRITTRAGALVTADLLVKQLNN